ncbi:hypothetical protein MTR67_023333 [Solanum verrucosum]|uniref:Uncharacterized protein n=1 Tax=Solanum verrucosum TaxID=315347 RepID=A0AAF0TYK3_SOLVR|nr:hypothetical protein MTR67_023333 [Solanum verrucosum]
MEGGKAVGPISEVEWVVVNSISDDFSESNSSSSSSIDMVDDDISSSFGPLYELSQLMAQLPIKRGLSKYYEGKSRSFGRLGSVMSLQDVAKEGKRMKSMTSKNFSGNKSGNYICLRMLKRSKDGSVARSGLFLSASCGNGEDIEELSIDLNQEPKEDANFCCHRELDDHDKVQVDAFLELEECLLISRKRGCPFLSS